jgi:hypothetical protein
MVENHVEGKHVDENHEDENRVEGKHVDENHVHENRVDENKPIISQYNLFKIVMKQMNLSIILYIVLILSIQYI